MTASMSAAVRTPPPAFRRRRAVRVGAVVGAAAGAAALWVVAVPVAGADLRVRMQGETQEIELLAVIGVSLLAGLLGWALLALLESRSGRAARIWTAVALVVAVLSLAGPLTSADGAAAAVLVGLHLTVAAILIPVLRRSSAAR